MVIEACMGGRGFWWGGQDRNVNAEDEPQQSRKHRKSDYVRFG